MERWLNESSHTGTHLFSSVYHRVVVFYLEFSSLVIFILKLLGVNVCTHVNYRDQRENTINTLKPNNHKDSYQVVAPKNTVRLLPFKPLYCSIVSHVGRSKSKR